MEDSNQEPTIQSKPLQKELETPSLHLHTQKFYMLLIILGIIFLASIFTAVLYLIGSRTTKNQQKQTTNLTKIPTPTLLLSKASVTEDNQTLNWKTYINNSLGITLKYPSFYNPVEKFNPQKPGLLTLSSNFNFDTNKLSICKSYSGDMCIIPGKNHSQKEDIQPIVIDNKNAVSFFIFTGKNAGSDVLHVVHTTEEQPFEISMSVAGMGGEETFNQILSTFKFLD